MTGAHKLDAIAARFDPNLEVTTSKWFGKTCLKTGGKVFATFFGSDLAFKLTGQAHAEALQIEAFAADVAASTASG